MLAPETSSYSNSKSNNAYLQHFSHADFDIQRHHSKCVRLIGTRWNVGCLNGRRRKGGMSQEDCLEEGLHCTPRQWELKHNCWNGRRKGKGRQIAGRSRTRSSTSRLEERGGNKRMGMKPRNRRRDWVNEVEYIEEGGWTTHKCRQVSEWKMKYPQAKSQSVRVRPFRYAAAARLRYNQYRAGEEWRDGEERKNGRVEDEREETRNERPQEWVRENGKRGERERKKDSARGIHSTHRLCLLYHLSLLLYQYHHSAHSSCLSMPLSNGSHFPLQYFPVYHPIMHIFTYITCMNKANSRKNTKATYSTTCTEDHYISKSVGNKSESKCDRVSQPIIQFSPLHYTANIVVLMRKGNFANQQIICNFTT